MKTIYLLRHAKSSWENQILEDHERPLNERGRRDSNNMAKYLHSKGILPAIALCSTSKRTKETYSYFTPYFSGIPLSLTRNLYHASVEALEEVIRSVDSDKSDALIIGHNNGLSEFVSIVMNKNISLSTCSFTTIQFPVEDWKDIDLINAEVTFALSPKEIPG